MFTSRFSTHGHENAQRTPAPSHVPLSTHKNIFGSPFTSHSTKIVLLGNPGVGKSTIHNTLLGMLDSDSGICLGEGLTRTTRTTCNAGFTCVDTPGLDDVYHKEQAARQISAALRGPCNVKLVFVTTLESGRVRTADITTLAIILEALSQVVGDVRDKYLLIINKCEPSVYEQLSNAASEMEARARVFGPYKAISDVSRFALLRYEPVASGKTNVMLEQLDVEKLRKVITDIPTIELPHEPVVSLDVARYEQSKEELDDNINSFYQGLDRVLEGASSGDFENEKFTASRGAFGDGAEYGHAERGGGKIGRGLERITDLLQGLEPLTALGHLIFGIVMIFL